MKAKHHFVSSLAAGGILLAVTGKVSVLSGTLVGGFLIDLDHVIDRLWSRKVLATEHGSDETEGAATISSGSLSSLTRRILGSRKLLRLPLVFHSYELLVVLAIATLVTRNAFLIGLVVGYALHLALDLYRHHHEFQSPLFYMLTYRMAQGFKRERLIKPRYL